MNALDESFVFSPVTRAHWAASWLSVAFFNQAGLASVSYALDGSGVSPTVRHLGELLAWPTVIVCVVATALVAAPSLQRLSWPLALGRIAMLTVALLSSAWLVFLGNWHRRLLDFRPRHRWEEGQYLETALRMTVELGPTYGGAAILIVVLAALVSWRVAWRRSAAFVAIFALVCTSGDLAYVATSVPVLAALKLPALLSLVRVATPALLTLSVAVLFPPRKTPVVAR